MDSLIERLEKATMPSFVLDHEIAAALGDANAKMFLEWVETNNPNYTVNSFAPRYTSSIDAALTLVPEGHTFCLWQDHRGNCAQVRKPSPISRGIVEPITKGVATPALALCIAALKARKAQESSNG